MSIDLVWPSAIADLDDEAILGLYEAGPGIRVNFVTSLDGAATIDGLSGGLGGPGDKCVFALLRRLADVVLVGAGTVRAEGYRGPLVTGDDAAWREAHGRATQPELIVASSPLDVPELLASLAGRRVLCEGGPHWFGTLLASDAVDELCLTMSPLLVGGTASRITAGAPEAPRGMHLAHVLRAGDELLLRYVR